MLARIFRELRQRFICCIRTEDSKTDDQTLVIPALMDASPARSRAASNPSTWTSEAGHSRHRPGAHSSSPAPLPPRAATVSAYRCSHHRVQGPASSAAWSRWAGARAAARVRHAVKGQCPRPHPTPSYSEVGVSAAAHCWAERSARLPPDWIAASLGGGGVRLDDSRSPGRNWHGW